MTPTVIFPSCLADWVELQRQRVSLLKPLDPSKDKTQKALLAGNSSFTWPGGEEQTTVLSTNHELSAAAPRSFPDLAFLPAHHLSLGVQEEVEGGFVSCPGLERVRALRPSVRSARAKAARQWRSPLTHLVAVLPRRPFLFRAPPRALPSPSTPLREEQLLPPHLGPRSRVAPVPVRWR